MTEARARPRWVVPLVLLAGVLLAVLTGFGGVVALLAGLLAQPLLALGISWWRGTRAPPARVAAACTEALPLLLAWSLALAVAALAYAAGMLFYGIPRAVMGSGGDGSGRGG